MPVVKGPRGPIPYERDALGYPRIRARDALDGAFALGHLHAKDRLLQVQLAVSLSQGRSMELFGDTPVFRLLDRVSRLFDFNGDAHMQVARVNDETRTFLGAYCDGFNGAADRRGRRMIYRLLGLDPGPHTPESMVTAYRLIAFFGLTSMQQSGEVTLAEIISKRSGGDRSAAKRLISILSGLPESALAHLDQLTDFRLPDELRLVLPHVGGSNAFAVSPARSKSGGALLMAEPHMEIGRFPPILYACHIDYESGGYYQGVGIPGIPWLNFGRTEHVGWACTYGHGDNVDTLVERVKDGKYFAKDEWLPLRKRVETVRVRGQEEPERWNYWDNEYGTVVGDAERGGELPCMRWSGIREVWRDINAVLPSMRARDVVELALHHRSTRCVSLNAVLADSSGTIGLVQTGQVDVRPADWAGVTPYPAWELPSRHPQTLGEDERPQVINPDEGFIATANERRDGPGGQRWTTLPEPRYRHQRLTELLRATEAADLSALVRASYDEVDLCAQRLLPIWKKFLPAAAEPLIRWSTRQEKAPRDEHRRLMGLFHTLHVEVTRVMLARQFNQLRGDTTSNANSRSTSGGVGARRFIHELSLHVVFHAHLDDAYALERTDVLAAEELAIILAHAWPAAVDRIARGKAAAPVKAGFRNVLLRGLLPTALGFDLPPSELPGGPTAPFQSRRVHFLGEEMIFGPAMHLVMDMSKPGSFYHVPGGASEERLGPGYAAGVDLWSEGRFIPLGDAEGKPPSLHPEPPSAKSRLGLATVTAKLPARAMKAARERLPLGRARAAKPR